MYGFWIIKGLVCLFLLFWYCVTISCLLLICTVLDLFCTFCYGVALDWIFLIRAWIVGIYFTIWIRHCEVWSGTWINICSVLGKHNAAHVYCKVSRKLNLNYSEGKDLSLQVLLLSFSFASRLSQCFVWNQGSDTRREFDWFSVFGASC